MTSLADVAVVAELADVADVAEWIFHRTPLSSIYENCVSAGKITSGKQAEYSNYIGSVVGYVESGKTTTITHCYWTSDVGNYNAYGSGNPTIGSETKQITLTHNNSGQPKQLQQFMEQMAFEYKQ